MRCCLDMGAPATFEQAVGGDLSSISKGPTRAISAPSTRGGGPADGAKRRRRGRSGVWVQ